MSTKASGSSFGLNPTEVATTLPSLNSSTAGIPETPYHGPQKSLSKKGNPKFGKGLENEIAEMGTGVGEN